jgi:hypothetical protein
MALHVLAYNLTRVLNIIGIKPMLAAVMAGHATLPHERPGLPSRVENGKICSKLCRAWCIATEAG